MGRTEGGRLKTGGGEWSDKKKKRDPVGEDCSERGAGWASRGLEAVLL